MLTMGLRVNSGLSRLAVTAFDAVFSLLLAVVWISCTAPSAFAYVDPSVMTYTIQALARRRGCPVGGPRRRMATGATFPPARFANR